MKQQSPFKFLDAYQQADKAVFFGREKEADKLYEALSGVKHLLVFGPSGAGKTSLIECGLRNQFSDADWFALSIRRGNNMNAAVYARINEALEEKIAIDPKTQLPKNENTRFGEAVELLFEEHFQPVYLLFDQFEELLILGKDAEKTAFFKNLNELIRYKIPCRILLIMREEFIGHLSEYEHLCPSIFKHRFRLEKMRKDKVGKVIEQILEAPTYQNFYKLDNSQALAKAILKNLPDEKREIELTHVQVFLSELWDRAKKKTTTNEPPVLKPALVEDTDNLEGVLNSFLKKQLRELDRNYKKDDALEVLESMISERYTKLQLSEKALTNDLERKGKQVELTILLQHLEQNRLIRSQKAGEQTQYEISHDLLALAVGQNLTEAMQMRQRAEEVYKVYEDQQDLLSSKDLKYLARYEDYKKYSTILKQKIDKSKDAIENEEHRELIKARKQTQRLGTLLAAAFFALCIAGWQFVESNKSKRNAIEAKIIAEQKTIVAERQKQIAIVTKEREEIERKKADSLRIKTEKMLQELQIQIDLAKKIEKERKAEEKRRVEEEQKRIKLELKTKFNLAQNYMNLEGFKVALNLLNEILKQDPENKKAIEMINTCKNKLK